MIGGNKIRVEFKFEEVENHKMEVLLHDFIPYWTMKDIFMRVVKTRGLNAERNGNAGSSFHKSWYDM